MYKIGRNRKCLQTFIKIYFCIQRLSCFCFIIYISKLSFSIKILWHCSNYIPKVNKLLCCNVETKVIVSVDFVENYDSVQTVSYSKTKKGNEKNMGKIELTERLKHKWASLQFFLTFNDSKKKEKSSLNDWKCLLMVQIDFNPFWSQKIFQMNLLKEKTKCSTKIVQFIFHFGFIYPKNFWYKKRNLINLKFWITIIEMKLLMEKLSNMRKKFNHNCCCKIMEALKVSFALEKNDCFKTSFILSSQRDNFFCCLFRLFHSS